MEQFLSNLRIILPVGLDIRPKYACRICTDGVTQAPAAPRLIEGGLPSEAPLYDTPCSTPRSVPPDLREIA